MGIVPTSLPGYAVDGGEGRSHLVGAPSTPAIPVPSGPLAVVQIPGPARPYAGVMPGPRPPVSRMVQTGIAASLRRTAVASNSTVATPIPPPPSRMLRVTPAPLTGAVPAFNPTTTAVAVDGPLAIPVPRLIAAGALILVGLSAGGAWRWLAVAGGVLAASGVWTFVTRGGDEHSAYAPGQQNATAPTSTRKLGGWGK